MKEIIWHGRGGQGAVMASRILTTAVVKDGKRAVGFPSFGAERRGAPVMAFTRLDDKPIREKTQIYNPDCVIVIDPELMHHVNVFQGVKIDGILVLNTPEQPEGHYDENIAVVGTVDATRIGLEEIGRPITNTAMLGAFARTTDWVSLPSIISSLKEYFQGPSVESNIRCVQRGYEETKITRVRGD